MKFKSALLFSSSLLSLIFSNFGMSAEVEKFDVDYQYVSISASKVNGIKVILKKEYERTDCNGMGIEASMSFLDGNQELETGKPINWNSTYFVTTANIHGIMGCNDLDQPVKTTATSRPLDFSSYTNPYIDKEVKINLIVPKGYEISVEEY